MKYRTYKQFKEMLENMVNGNWTDAGENGREYGFYANDILNMLDEYEDEFSYIDIKDIVLLVEVIQKGR